MLDLSKKQYRMISRAIPRNAKNAIDYHIAKFAKDVFSIDSDDNTAASDNKIINLYTTCESKIVEILSENYNSIIDNLYKGSLTGAEVTAYIAMRMMYIEPKATFLVLIAYQRRHNSFKLLDAPII